MLLLMVGFSRAGPIEQVYAHGESAEAPRRLQRELAGPHPILPVLSADVLALPFWLRLSAHPDLPLLLRSDKHRWL